MEKMDIRFFEKSFIDRSFLVLKILNAGTLCSPPFPLWIFKLRKPMVNRVEIYGHTEKSDLVVSVSRSYNFMESTVLFKKCTDIFKEFTVIIFKK